jgi:hypothetical protein
LTLLLLYIGATILKTTPISSKDGTNKRENLKTRIHFLFFSTMACSTLYFILTGQETRFSYVNCVLLLAWITQTNKQGALQAIFLSFLLASGVLLSGVAFYRMQQSQTRYNLSSQSSKLLLQTISKSPIGAPVYTLLDFSSRMASGESIQILAATQRKIIRGLSVNIDECHDGEARYFTYSVIKKTTDSVDAQVSIPKCAKFDFEGTEQNLLLKNLKGHNLKRSETISYDFPSIKIHKQNNMSTLIDWGWKANVVITNANAVIWNGSEWLWLR